MTGIGIEKTAVRVPRCTVLYTGIQFTVTEVVSTVDSERDIKYNTDGGFFHLTVYLIQKKYKFIICKLEFALIYVFLMHCAVKEI